LVTDAAGLPVDVVKGAASLVTDAAGLPVDVVKGAASLVGDAAQLGISLPLEVMEQIVGVFNVADMDIVTEMASFLK